MSEKIFYNKTRDVTPYRPFTLNEVLEPGAELIYLQRHTPTVVVGRADERLPFYLRGIDYLYNIGFETAVRDSGGLAVVLDEGVFTVSLITANPHHLLHVGDGFKRMSDFISRLIKPYGVIVKVGEVAGSYCPGKFDMSINGRKFAGISGRVTREVIQVNAYVCVEGKGYERAEIIKQFYEHVGAYGERVQGYPTINPASCASLQELLGKGVSVESFLTALEQKIDIAFKHIST